MMNKLATILKINILSLVCIPIFLISILFCMLGNVVKKFSTIIFAIFALVGVTLSVTILTHASEVLDMIFVIILIITLFSFIIILILNCISVATFVLLKISEVLYYILTTVGDSLNDLFLFLIDIIRNSMNSTIAGKQGKGFTLSYFMFYIMKGLYHGIIKILKYSYIYGYISCLSILVVMYLKFKEKITNIMGISLLHYIRLFRTIDIISSALIIITFFASLFIIIISLGYESSELAINIEQGGRYRYIDSCLDFTNAADIFEYDIFWDKLKQLNNDRIYVLQKAQDMFEQNLGSNELEQAVVENTSKWTKNMDKVINYIEDVCSNITQEKKQTLYWKINYLLSELESANRIVEEEIKQAETKNQKNKYSRAEYNPNKTSELHFFMGCKDLNSLEERRKKLAKIYHPDNETGDAESFKVMMLEYEKLKEMLSSSVS